MRGGRRTCRCFCSGRGRGRGRGRGSGESGQGGRRSKNLPSSFPYPHLRELADFDRSGITPLMDTFPGSSHMVDFHCYICGRKLIGRDHVFKIHRNAVWTSSPETDQIWLNPEAGVHPYKCKQNGDPCITKVVFCICSNWIGDFLQDYGSDSEGTPLSLYKFEFINRTHQRRNMCWIRSAAEHIPLVEGQTAPHPEAWQSEKRDTEKRAVGYLNKTHGTNFSETNPEDLDEVQHLMRELNIRPARLPDTSTTTPSSSTTSTTSMISTTSTTKSSTSEDQ